MKNLTSGGYQVTIKDPPHPPTIVRWHQVPSEGQSFYVGRCCCQKPVMLSGNALTICKSHVNLLNFGWKGGIVYDEIYVGSQAVQCANCKAVDVIGFRD